MTPYDQWKRSAWDDAHATQNISALTGTGFLPHVSCLGVAEFIQPTAKVLCIGVGTGQWVRECAQKVADVRALDISPMASKNLEEIVLVTNAEELPDSHFDLALSHYVAVHVSDHDLEVQLRNVIRSLKPSGIFAMHYKEPLRPDQPVDNWAGESKEVEVAICAFMLRRREHMKEMVRWAGGKVIKYVADIPCEAQEMREVVIHIGRAE